MSEQMEEETKNDVFWHAQFCVRACVHACLRESRMNRALIDVAADGVCQSAGLRVTKLTFLSYTEFSGSWFRASAMTTMNKKPTRCTIVLK
jgi:hypothetical protein